MNSRYIKKNKLVFAFINFIIFLTFSDIAFGKIQMPAIFSNHMVLQSNTSAPVWGYADSKQKITVDIAGKTFSTVADKNGKWMINVTLPAGEPYEMKISSEVPKDCIVIKDILAGDVWLCSGQSNMQWPLEKNLNATKEIEEAKYPKIRLFFQKRACPLTPQTRLEGRWFVCSPKSAAQFSAVGYFFGQKLFKDLDIPLGLINCNWGGTPAEAWTDIESLKNTPALDEYAQAFMNAPDDYKIAKANYDKAMKEWNAKAELAKSNGTPTPKAPIPPREPGKHPYMPCVIYNGMIAPLAPYGIKGVIWYQGESNVPKAHIYSELLTAMINGWRDAWQEGDFPFLIVQLTNYGPLQNKPNTDNDWAFLREAQQKVADTVKNTWMINTIDLGDGKLHPENKREFGERLAMLALSKVYHKEMVATYPQYAGMKIKNNQIDITFKNVNDGFITPNNEPIQGFLIAGQNHEFYFADASINGNSVLLSSPNVLNPVAVRYAWANNPQSNLRSKSGLPLMPFRTDNWPDALYKK